MFLVKCFFTRLVNYFRTIRDIPWVATTADSWTAHNLSYLGMTAHWIDTVTKKRQRAVLACSRLKGHQTFNVLAEAIINIHYKFHLQDKITRTTTDNGRNFVKAFVQFGTEADLVPNCDENLDGSDVDEWMEEAFEEEEPENSIEFISLESTMENNKNSGYNLPTHMRCAAHTFNLIASVDVNKALGNSNFKGLHRKVTAKAQALWNQQNRSSISADLIEEEFKRRLVVPSATRWNSLYDSLVVLKDILERDRGVFHRVMHTLKLQTFNDSEINFLQEYIQVMGIVAAALDKVQGEDQAYLGSLLPTIAATAMKLSDLKTKNLQYCRPLVDALLSGISKRFDNLQEDLECHLAAAFHPKFRLMWLEKYDQKKMCSVKSAMEKVVEEALKEEDHDDSIASSTDDEGLDFFNSITKTPEKHKKSVKVKAKNLVKNWLEASSKDVTNEAAFLGEKIYSDLFLKYNTSIPSSAAVERLFSIGKDILRAKRASLSDSNFEMLIFMKGNDHHLRALNLNDHQ